MARHKAIPKVFGRVHERYQTPDAATIWFGVGSIAWYVGLTKVSENILADSIAALGLMIAIYYGLTGFAAAIYYRREMFNDERTADTIGALVFGGLALIGAGFFLVDVASTQTNAWTGVLDHGSIVNAIAFGAAWLGVAGLVIGIPAAFLRTRSVRNLVLVGAAGTVGGAVLAWAFFKSSIDLWDPANSESGDSWFGIGPPFVIGIGGMVLGAVLMQLYSLGHPEFFRRKVRVAPPGSLDPPAGGAAPAIAGGAPLPGEELPRTDSKGAPEPAPQSLGESEGAPPGPKPTNPASRGEEA